MRVKDIFMAEKKILDWGKWNQGGKVPKSLFYLIKSNQFQFGKAYRWRVIKFEALGEYFRVLVVYNLNKEQFYAHLGMEIGRDMKLLTSYEFHGTHSGWHVHSACGLIEHIPVGRQKGPWNRRIPRAKQHHRNTEYGVTDVNAADKACKAFNIVEEVDEGGQMLLT